MSNAARRDVAELAASRSQPQPELESERQA